MRSRCASAALLLLLLLSGCLGAGGKLAKDVQRPGPLYPGLGPDAAGPRQLAKGTAGYAFPAQDPAHASSSSMDIPLAMPSNASHLALDQALTYTGYMYSIMYVIDPQGNPVADSASCQGIGAFTRPDIDQAKACHVDVYPDLNSSTVLAPGRWTIRVQWNDVLGQDRGGEGAETGSVSWLVDTALPAPPRS